MKYVFLSMLLWSGLAHAQSIMTRDKQFEVGLNFGSLVYLGDIQGNRGIGTQFIKDVNIPNTTVISGVNFTYYPNFMWSHFGFKFGASKGLMSAIDSLIKNHNGAEVYRKNRNLSFRTPITEVYGQIEYYITNTTVRPYIGVGLGYLWFRPQANYNGHWVDLEPLHTEGVRYRTNIPIIPVGFGVKYFTRKDKVWSFEVLYRRTNTDYLDDVSTVYPDPSILGSQMARDLSNRSRVPVAIGEQRGDPKDKDSYFSIVVKYSFLMDPRDGLRTTRQVRCPKFY